MTERFSWHGGGLEAAKQRFGAGGGSWLDLSTGINPVAWPGVDAVDIDWRRLPEQDALARLEAVAADFFGADPRHVCAVPGTEIGLRIAGRMIGGTARHVAPCYRTHGDMFAGSEATTWSAAKDGDGALIVANPNNPDGRVLAAADLHALLERRSAADWTLVDEAFADALPETSVARHVRDDRRLIVFRSFGKFFGLAGVRLGFILGPQAFIASLRGLLGAWPVSAAAVAIGTAAYRDADWAKEARARLPTSAAALDAVLDRHGLAAKGDCPLFRLVETPDAHALFDRLALAAILTRPFAEQPGWLRFGLPPDAAALARLDAALADG